MNPSNTSAVGIPDVDNVEALSSMLQNKNPLLASYISFSSSNLVSQEYLVDAAPNNKAQDVSDNQNRSFNEETSSIDTAELSEETMCSQSQHKETPPVRIITVDNHNAVNAAGAFPIVVASTVTGEATCGRKRSYLADFLSAKSEDSKRQRRT